MESAAENAEYASGSAIRQLLKEGEREQALEKMAPAMAEIYLKEEQAGRAPVFQDICERAILAKLRSMEEADFAALDEGKEGLYRRLYRAAGTGTSVTEILESAKTKRYAYTRLSRMLLWAYLGIAPKDCPEHPPYLRPLAMNPTGCQLLAKMKKTAAIPILTKPADVRRLGETAQRLFALEARAADLYALAYPDLSAARGGEIWRESPAVVSAKPGKESLL